METKVLQERVGALLPKTDYMEMVEVTMGMAGGATVTAELTGGEIAAVLDAYDNGIDKMHATRRADLYAAIAKLKRELWP